jgi:hypothetical protein
MLPAGLFKLSIRLKRPINWLQMMLSPSTAFAKTAAASRCWSPCAIFEWNRDEGVAFVVDLMECKHVEGALSDGSAGFNRILVCDVSRQGRFQRYGWRL